MVYWMQWLIYHIYLDLISFDITLKFSNRLDAHLVDYVFEAI